MVPAEARVARLVDEPRQNASLAAGGVVRAGRVRLLFVSPERMVTDRFQTFLHEIGVRTFAIDEAHCISHWGHDFRPEYRQLNQLKDLFPKASVTWLSRFALS